MTRNEPFYKEGIRFECQDEGRCCVTRGRYSYVYLSFSDRRRLASHFGLSTTVFTGQYTVKEEGRYQLKDADKNCPFFINNRCEVYPARPWQCRTWPFWPENMSRTVWEKEVVPYCPGVGKGRLYSAEEIELIIAKKMDVSGWPPSQKTLDTDTNNDTIQV